MHLTLSDVIGFVAFGGFGVWWLLYPSAVRRFYTWFHRGRARPPSDRSIRVVGAAWLSLLILVFWRVFD